MTKEEAKKILMNIIGQLPLKRDEYLKLEMAVRVLAEPAVVKKVEQQQDGPA